MFVLEAIAAGEKTVNKLWERREWQKEKHEAALFDAIVEFSGQKETNITLEVGR